MFLDKLMRLHSHFYQWIMPPICVLCGMTTNAHHPICLACQHDLPILSHSCEKCAQFLPITAQQSLLCGACLKHPPLFDRTYALFSYQPPIIPLIIQLKFRRQLNIASALGLLMARAIRDHWYVDKALPDLIIPIPLHVSRLRERGFNQALEIARPIANSFSLPLDRHGMVRVKNTAAQSGLSAVLRKENIHGAFKAKRSYAGLSVAVMDDVITTGHTISEFCKILKQNGAKSIDVWCCARRDIAITAKTR